MTELNISQLQSDFTGRLVGQADSDYDQLRTIFYGGFDKKPALIVLAANETDIQKAIALAKSTDRELAVRSGGHSVAGFCSTDGGIVIDLRNMKAHDINVEEKTVWAEAGMTAGQLTEAADAYDLAIGFGDTGSVGIGGITLGGGVGFLVRKFGLAIDNLLAAEIVTADGEILQIDQHNHPDLFWAVRGGGGNFGVVTRFKFQLHELKEAYGGMLFLPAEPKVVTGFIAAAEQAPEELSTILNIMPAPPMPGLPPEVHGKLIIFAMLMYVGNQLNAEQALAPFRALAKPIADQLKPMRYKEMFPSNHGGGEYHPTAVSHTMFMNQVDLPLAQNMITELTNSDAAMRVVQLRVLGGAMARVPANATAFAHRSSKIMTNVAAFFTGAEEKSIRTKWVMDLADQLQQDDHGAYVGFVGEHEEARLTETYPPATLERLRQVKRQYDPGNVFHLNINIQPS